MIEVLIGLEGTLIEERKELFEWTLEGSTASTCTFYGPDEATQMCGRPCVRTVDFGLPWPMPVIAAPSWGERLDGFNHLQ